MFDSTRLSTRSKNQHNAWCITVPYFGSKQDADAHRMQCELPLLDAVTYLCLVKFQTENVGSLKDWAKLQIS